MNSDLRAVNEWAVLNELELNAEKTMTMLIGAPNLVLPKVVLNGVVVPLCKVVKSLGLLINDRFTWSSHASKVSQRIYIGLRNLWPLARSTPLRTRHMLAKSLLLPHLDYCSSVFFYGLDSAAMKILNRSVKSIVRYVYGLGRFESSLAYVDRFLGCSLDTFLKVRSMCFLHKIYWSGKPEYLRELLLSGVSARSMQLRIPHFDLALGKKTFFVQGLIDWNSIPANIRTIRSIQVFKNRCTELFHRRCNPNIYD